MRMITIVSLGASAVLGLAALFVAKTVLPNTAAAKQAALGGPAAAGTPIVVAAKDIKYGDKLDAAMLTVVRVPQGVAPQGAFANVQQALSADHGGPPVALMPMAAHEAVLPTKLSGPGARPSVAAEVAEGMRAYAIRVTDVTGVGGHALPGDRVDVVLMRDLTPTGQTRSYVSDVIVQNVRVLGIDLNADLSSDKPAEPKNVTLEVSVADAQKLAIGSTLGTLSVALRRSGEAEEAQVRTMTTPAFLSGGGGGGIPGAVHHRNGGGVRSGAGLMTVVEYGGKGGSSAARAPAVPAPPPTASAAAAQAPAGQPASNKPA